VQVGVTDTAEEDLDLHVRRARLPALDLERGERRVR
jgi:hypothetical protein